jgi:hypothetical protein
MTLHDSGRARLFSDTAKAIIDRMKGESMNMKLRNQSVYFRVAIGSKKMIRPDQASLTPKSPAVHPAPKQRLASLNSRPTSPPHVLFALAASPYTARTYSFPFFGHRVWFIITRHRVAIFQPPKRKFKLRNLLRCNRLRLCV